jgi:hypothetical protein
MIGIIFILAITYGVGYLVHLAAKSKVRLIDGKIVSIEAQLAKESRMVFLTKEKFYGQQIIRRNPNRRKGEKREKKKKVIGFRE